MTPPQTLKIQILFGNDVTKGGHGPQFKINSLCFLVTDIRTTQIFMTSVRLLCLIFILQFHYVTDKIASHVTVK